MDLPRYSAYVPPTNYRRREIGFLGGIFGFSMNIPSRQISRKCHFDEPTSSTFRPLFAVLGISMNIPSGQSTQNLHFSDIFGFSMNIPSRQITQKWHFDERTDSTFHPFSPVLGISMNIPSRQITQNWHFGGIFGFSMNIPSRQIIQKWHIDEPPLGDFHSFHAELRFWWTSPRRFSHFQRKT